MCVPGVESRNLAYVFSRMSVHHEYGASNCHTDTVKWMGHCGCKWIRKRAENYKRKRKKIIIKMTVLQLLW